ncbi:DUF3040 domain-containing protein [Glycomyces sp. TRM65418]|uniref:DUF3040 domain-containing protein n=1 Tax=Glycomyces sp. TRM65418 TaxID=2867006 RepID=UPI001CE62525|nr:DUF3040 domain-containing protein [Glycomyces sp. TRM65418]MCC3761984.1 DUF3040 domain-containing protein [Glycomyces sp. TRM65418]QZD56059.1 DUF3040 domain-containing protein [Glycomyces sp. TRM65418]
MPLSDHEQRLFEQIEQSLSEDPQFASAVRAHDPAHVTRRRLILAGIITVIGIGAVIGTVIAGGAAAMWGAPIGAVLMFGGLLLGLWAQRRGTNVKLKAVDGKASRSVGGSKSPKPGGFTSRMEERWRRRRDNGDIF